ncbi:LOW QUALITY PROTEIN: hypothetical protein TorRG33x02_061500 [Trema orientale]|uniref:Uncharacterized protein n=1 Tax=Trema orientale TaxID=63057 RepID=A0A2P5FJZ3_TREOI|nr:LOW QUALITY PROTEIN: hypothetical protein TorRG33x02_061500 [Trema orientale]
MMVESGDVSHGGQATQTNFSSFYMDLASVEFKIFE